VLVTPPVEFGNIEPTPPVAEPRYSFSFEVSQEVMDLYTEARAIMGHLKPEEVFEKALKHFIEQKKQAPRVVAARIIVKQDKPVTPNSRAIPLNTRRAVLQRDKYQCSYCAADGTQCRERVGLEIDHIKPFALGGTHEIDNLRVVCKAHNGFFAEQVFGRDFMRGKKARATDNTILRSELYTTKTP
jgi:5-methylcytosine-specific restriction endonuclease McrA